MFYHFVFPVLFCGFILLKFVKLQDTIDVNSTVTRPIAACTSNWCKNFELEMQIHNLEIKHNVNSPENISDVTNNFCDVFKNDSWNIIQKYLFNTKTLEVTEMLNNTKNDRWIKDFTGAVLKRLESVFDRIIVFRNVNQSHDEPITYASTFSWRGQQLESRSKSKNTTFLAANLTERLTHLMYTRSYHLVIARSIHVINDYLVGYPRYPMHVTYGNMIFLTLDSIDDELKMEEWKKINENVLERLWKDYGLLNTIVMSPCMVRNFGFYDPFNRNGKNITDSWGSTNWVKYNESRSVKRILKDKLTSFNGYPLIMSIFRRTPTALKGHELPQAYHFNDILERAKPLAKGYGGFDGLILGNLAQSLNFNAIVKPPSDKIEYGWMWDNGTFTGTIGDVLYRRADISFNGRFVKNYGTNEIEFMFPVYFDRLCIISPKALVIPQWVAIFLCFNLTVWFTFIVFNFFCGFVWYLLKRWAAHRIKVGVLKMKAHEHHSAEYNRFVVITIEMWMIMLASPSAQMPFRTTERFFMTACLLANLIIAGTFQGLLTTSFSTKSYYKDINTLEELDKSGLLIGTSSKSLMDIFGTNGSATLQSLNSKYRLLVNETTMYRAAYKRDICCVERYSDAKLIINDKYERADGSPMLHRIEQCPRSYYLAYVVKKGWPFLMKLNMVLRRYFEAGLLTKWYEDTETSIILEKKVNQPPSDEGKTVAFTIIDMQTSFFILLFGLLFCFIAFICEIVVKIFGTPRGQNKFKRKNSWDAVKNKFTNKKSPL